jgi:hypothetical protein
LNLGPIVRQLLRVINDMNDVVPVAAWLALRTLHLIDTQKDSFFNQNVRVSRLIVLIEMADHLSKPLQNLEFQISHVHKVLLTNSEVAHPLDHDLSVHIDHALVHLVSSLLLPQALLFSD